MDSKQAMKLALKALESCGWNDGYAGENQYFHDDLVDKAITALREALAEQPAQQEPVAWEYCEEIYDKSDPALNDYIRANGIPLYTTTQAQRTWVGLTDVEIASACKKNGGAEWWWRDIEEFAKAIEAKLKEKNT